MSDSCKLRNVFPGFAQRYSKFKVFKTSTMKSEPGRSTVIASAAPGASGSGFSSGGGPAGRAGVGETRFAACAAGLVTNATVPAAAALRKSRRLTESFFALRTVHPLVDVERVLRNANFRIMGFVIGNHYFSERWRSR